jgi:hypothetical protein
MNTLSENYKKKGIEKIIRKRKDVPFSNRQEGLLTFWHTYNFLSYPIRVLQCPTTSINKLPYDIDRQSFSFLF